MSVCRPLARNADRYCLFHLHAHPMEQMTAAASLILGGVLERHPRLRVGFMEAGCGWVPYWLERMDEHAENYRFELPHLKERPSAYFRRQCFVSFELEERAVSYVAETVGPQTLVFASDFPHHDCFFSGAVEKIRRRADLDGKLVTAMLSDNPHRLCFAIRLPHKLLQLAGGSLAAFVFFPLLSWGRKQIRGQSFTSRPKA